MSRQITIHSDGTGRGTVVLDEDGAQIGGMTDVDVSVQPNGVVEATLTLRGVALNVTANVTTVVHNCPMCGDSVEHVCDQTFGNLGSTMCPSQLIERDPARTTQCIRGASHAGSHFDGERAWY